MISDRLRSYKKVMLTGSLVSLVGYTVAIYFPMPSFLMTYPLFFVIGFALGAQFFAFASICELNPRQVQQPQVGSRTWLT